MARDKAGKRMSETPEADPYDELAQATKLLAGYRRYRDQAKERMAEAIKEETQNMAYETERIEQVEAIIRKLLADTGLNDTLPQK